MDTRPTASIIIIGDEILKGQTKDTNSHFLCKELYKCGIRVARVSVISDDIDAIGEEVLSQSNRYTYVITSGGIGPTHDDVTYEGVAKAFSEKLTLNKDLQKILAQLCLRLNLNESAAFKMSHIPQTAEIHRTGDGFIPIVSVRNVYIFPGIPSYLECSFNKLKSVFSVLATPYFNRCLYINANEFEIAEILNAAVKEFDQRVKFGSYPEVNSEYFQVKLVLEANSKEAIIDAEAYLRSHLPMNSVVRQHPPDAEDALKLILNIIHKKPPPFDTEFSTTLEKSLKILEECFDKYSILDTCLSFNGGKDCTVLLHLAFLFLTNKNLTHGKKLKVLYVRTNQPFPEIEEFIEQCIPRYNLEVLTYNQSIKEALVKLKNDKPEIEAVLMGSRLTDPHCSSLQPFQKTDQDWPQFMRVNPLAHWSYSDVWKFLCELDVPYCSLYDKGYTSLGCPHNTLPNEQLLTTTKEGIPYYKPAYLLNDPKQERKGRSIKKSF